MDVLKTTSPNAVPRAPYASPRNARPSSSMSTAACATGPPGACSGQVQRRAEDAGGNLAHDRSRVKQGPRPPSGNVWLWIRPSFDNYGTSSARPPSPGLSPKKPWGRGEFDPASARHPTASARRPLSRPLPPKTLGERRIRSRFGKDRTASARRPPLPAAPPKNPGGEENSIPLRQGSNCVREAPPLPASPPNPWGRGEFDPAATRFRIASPFPHAVCGGRAGDGGRLTIPPAPIPNSPPPRSAPLPRSWGGGRQPSQGTSGRPGGGEGSGGRGAADVSLPRGKSIAPRLHPPGPPPPTLAGRHAGPRRRVHLLRRGAGRAGGRSQLLPLDRPPLQPVPGAAGGGGGRGDRHLRGAPAGRRAGGGADAGGAGRRTTIRTSRRASRTGRTSAPGRGTWKTRARRERRMPSWRLT